MDEMDSECFKTAIHNGDLNQLNSILKNCSVQYINNINFHGVSPVQFAIDCARNKRWVFSKQLMPGDNCKCLLSNQDGSEMSCVYQNDEIILSLINAGADVNSKEILSSMTPLMSALKDRRGCAVLHRLIDVGSDVNAQCLDEKIPLMFAIESNCNSKIISKLIIRGSKVNHRDIDGWTSLLYAVKFSKDLEIVHMLINAGANVNVLDDVGRNLLMHMQHINEYCADEFCYNRVYIDALITHGIDVKFVDLKGNSVLHRSDCKYLIEIVVKYGVSVNLRTNKGLTALHLATFNYDLKKVKKLLSLGADPNCVDLSLNTPLHSLDDDDLIAFLLYYGASLNALNARQQTPIDVLLDCNHYDEWSTKSGVRAFLKHFLLFVNKHGYREDSYFLKLDDYVRKHLHSFKNKCKKEIYRMRKRCISENLTFYQFCNLKRLHASEIVDISVKNYNYTYNRIKSLFPIYQNMIILRMRDNQGARLNRLLRKNLERIIVRPLTHDEADSDVTLDYDCMYDICRFLNRKHIYNLYLSSFV